mmetsp:Transcript_29037/g.35387  ORF Transcript_29037/g.35387 Transcript_29037/m.35387 type:complete len:495 (-) Transcript_29037:183-1667(-)
MLKSLSFAVLIAAATSDPHAAGRDRYQQMLEHRERQLQAGKHGNDAGSSYGGGGNVPPPPYGAGGSSSVGSDGLDGTGGDGPDSTPSGQNNNGVQTVDGGYNGGTNEGGTHGGGSRPSNPAKILNTPLTGDYQIRFNKITILDGSGDTGITLPLRVQQFPLSGNLLTKFKERTNCPSVVGLDDYEVMLDVMKLITTGHGMNGFPTHATSDTSSVFWSMFEEVCLMQVARMTNGEADGSTIGMPLPDTWAGYTLDMIAEAVHDEYPNYHQSNNLASMLSKGGVSIDNEVIPRRSLKQFLRGPVMMADMNTWATGIVGPHSFAAKYAVGRARPEEIFWAIYTEEIPASDLPTGARTAYEQLKRLLSAGSYGSIASATLFTAYEEGSPQHPSWPAMHSAASQTSFWLSVVLDLTPSQLCQARLIDYAVAYARTVAGVHYPDDNIDGLNLGQAVLIDVLPDHLHLQYGADKETVKAKIEGVKYDWNDFDPADPCPFDN